MVRERKKLKVYLKKWKVLVVGRKEVATQVKLEMNGKIVEVTSSFEYLDSSSNKDGGPQDNVKMSVGEGPKTFGTIHTDCYVYGAETWGINRDAISVVP